MLSALPERHPLRSYAAEAPLIRAYRGDRPEVTPVWFMRQAGRSLPEYRALRQGRDMLDTCLVPELASEITLQPVRRHGVDAGIFFSDIMIPLRLAGVDVTIEPGIGPVVAEPADSPEAIERITSLELTDAALEPIREAVRLTVRELEQTGTPLIGFAGAPFTLAAYLVAGRPTKDHMPVRTLMHAYPEAWRQLAQWAAGVTGKFLREQVLAGASAAQLFDSWAGSLPKRQYVDRVVPHSRAALDAVRDLDVPLVHFGVGAAELYGEMNLDVDTVGVDWRTPLDEAIQRIPGDVTVQGNLDPALLGAGWEAIEPAVRDVLERGRSARAHVFNLGHGVPPEADPEQLTRIVELVHSV
ncbi:MAG TPA: uroporphyrinogen decarboxylase [Candidatus Agrococcus pullicola]|uniref:Uroporphyrinogen decarboxylase n=1 Tax=Candidatus Agrococcus pullicola TaxID=2838429 RepID=A0A9D2CA46_9MICO|nr:uroporphyrinogen decarboxylase [Candidatus Agrococcus pullicola]